MPSVQAWVCQNIDIRLSSRASNPSDAASHFQEHLMVNLWNSVQLIEQLLQLWTLR